MMSLDDDALRDCQTILGHAFADVSPLRKSLVHASAATIRIESNERLEFLGDAILGGVICDELFHRFRNQAEGDLTRMKSAVVSRSACTRVTKAIGLDRFVVLGKGVASKSGKIPGSILAAVLEAVIAAIYLDAGYEATRQFIVRVFEEELKRAAQTDADENFKSELQQRAQKSFGETPSYHVLDESGPDHLKSFKVSASIGPHAYQAAWGTSKKQAEQRAAHNALSELDGLAPPFSEDDQPE